MNITRNARLIGGIGAAGAGAGLGASLSAVSLDSADLLLTLGLALAAVGLLLVSAGWFWPRPHRQSEELAMLALAITLGRLNPTREQAITLLEALHETDLIVTTNYDILLRVLPMLIKTKSPQSTSPKSVEETLREVERFLAGTR